MSGSVGDTSVSFVRQQQDEQTVDVFEGRVRIWVVVGCPAEHSSCLVLSCVLLTSSGFMMVLIVPGDPCLIKGQVSVCSFPTMPPK